MRSLFFSVQRQHQRKPFITTPKEVSRWQRNVTNTATRAILISSQNAQQDSQSNVHRYLLPLVGIAVGATLVQQQLVNNNNTDQKITFCEGGSNPEPPVAVNADANADATDSSQKLRMCGEWCSSANESAPCRMDNSKVPCLGKHCATTAGFWSLFMLGPYSKNRPISCQLYKDGVGYPIGGCPCDPSCLIAEIKKERYPQPTGMGVFCKPNTCVPAASPRHQDKGEGLGTLACPCNWFGSECTDDWIPIQHLEKKRIGSLDRVTLTVNKSKWGKLMKDYRPGAVVRLNMKNGEFIHELACVVSGMDAAKGQLDLLVAPPDSSLDPSVRYVTDLLRSHEEGIIVPKDEQSKMYVNPAISGFYNSRYQFLTEYIAEHKVKKVIVLATGSGLGGAVSVIEGLKDDSGVAVRLYYGVRDIASIPYSEKLSEWVRSGKVELILVESDASKVAAAAAAGAVDQAAEDQDDLPSQIEELSPEVQLAAAIGDAIKGILWTPEDRNKKYVQDIFEYHLNKLRVFGSVDNTSGDGDNNDADSVVVVCGRLQVIDATRTILEAHGRDVEERLFLNI